MPEGSLITDMNVREFFRDSVRDALNHQKLDAAEDTVFYVVNLLVYFSRAENLFTATPDGPLLQPLALIYAEAVEARGAQERQAALRRLGDVALLIAGLFSASLSRKLVDVDYYIAMGGSAYGHLADLQRGSNVHRSFCAIFGELAHKFQRFVDVLDEVRDKTHLGSSTDVLRLYEIWLKTGSPRAGERLRQLGIQPVAALSRYN
jgi:hypothetical protein